MLEVYQEIEVHKQQIELLQARIAFHLGRISLCETLIAAQGENDG